jgi:hypothetical protein
VGLGGWEDEEGEKEDGAEGYAEDGAEGYAEDGAEGYAEDGGVVWNAEACFPI